VGFYIRWDGGESGVASTMALGGGAGGKWFVQGAVLGMDLYTVFATIFSQDPI
jgi:hypothetical protein